jgi:hypothetical protein
MQAKAIPPGDTLQYGSTSNKGGQKVTPIRESLMPQDNGYADPPPQDNGYADPPPQDNGYADPPPQDNGYADPPTVHREFPTRRSMSTVAPALRCLDPPAQQGATALRPKKGLRHLKKEATRRASSATIRPKLAQKKTLYGYGASLHLYGYGASLGLLSMETELVFVPSADTELSLDHLRIRSFSRPSMETQLISMPSTDTELLFRPSTNTKLLLLW